MEAELRAPGAPSAIDVSVVVPCYNEAANVDELVARLRAVCAAARLGGQIVLVNDGSQDETGPAIDRLAQAFPDVTACHHARNRGMEAGWRTGVAAARGRTVCFIDADLQYAPEDIARLYQALVESGADIAQGSRVTPRSVRDSRYLFSRGLNLLLNVAFGMQLEDNKSGFVLGRREVIAHALEHRRTYRYFQALLLVSAHAKGYRIHSISTEFGPRRRGQSFMSNVPVRVVWGCFLDVLTGLVEFRFGSGQQRS